MSTPPLGTSVMMGVRAASREAWLLPVSTLVALLRSVAIVPALAFAVALPLEKGLAAATSIRYAAIVSALALAGVASSGLLRVLFLAGALPTLGARLAGDATPRAFAAGVAWGLPRQLATWFLSVLAEIAAAGYLLAVLIATLQASTGGSLRAEHPMVLAAFGALALATGVAGLVVASVVGDAAAARTAILGEGPGAAFAGAVRRYLSRPGAFTLGGLAAAMAAVSVGSVLQPATGLLGQLGSRLGWAVGLGPQLMLAVLAAFGAAAMDLWWLGSVSALACAEVRDEER